MITPASICDQFYHYEADLEELGFKLHLSANGRRSVKNCEQLWRILDNIIMANWGLLMTLMRLAAASMEAVTRSLERLAMVQHSHADLRALQLWLRKRNGPTTPIPGHTRDIPCASGWYAQGIVLAIYVWFSSVRMDESRLVDTSLGRGAGAVSRGRMTTIHFGRTTPWSWMNDLRVAELEFRERPSIGVRLNFEAILT